MRRRTTMQIVKCDFAVVLMLASIAGSAPKLLALSSTSSLSQHRQHYHRRHNRPHFLHNEISTTRIALSNDGNLGVVGSKGEDTVRLRDLLSDLPTPTLLIELSLAENALNNTFVSLDNLLENRGGISNERNDQDGAVSSDANTMAVLDGSIFVHTRVTDTSARDRINQELGSGKSPVIGSVDATSQQHVPGGAFLGIGLSNHHVGGYYWARGMGIGASLEAHGVAFRDAALASSSSPDLPNGDGGGELYWEKRGDDPASNPGVAVARGATTYESSNSNDGKRSEWADFLVRSDTVQLIPYNATRVLYESAFRRLVGVRRVGRPLGADPIVERLWERQVGESNCDSWTPL